MSEEQPWEKLRQTVRVASDETQTDAESRFARLEDRVHHIEVTQGQQIAQLVQAYQHIAASMDKLVTRHEFQGLRVMVIGLCAAGAIGLLKWIFWR